MTVDLTSACNQEYMSASVFHIVLHFLVPGLIAFIFLNFPHGPAIRLANLSIAERLNQIAGCLHTCRPEV